MSATEPPQTPKEIAYVLLDVGEISRIIIEECGASMVEAVIAADRILEYIAKLEGEP